MLDDAIFAAALSADSPLLRRLLVDHASTAHGRLAPLWLAASEGKADVVRVLLAVGVDADAADGSGTTALMCAAVQNYATIVELCLAAGAQPLRVRQDGQTAVSLAAFFGRASSLGALFRFDASLVGSTDALQRTPLHCAVIGGQTLTVKYLLGRWGAHAHLASVDAEGNTPLHLCRGPAELATLLIYGGESKSAVGRRNAAGLTAAEAALAAGLAPDDAVLGAMDACNADRVDRRIFAFLHSSLLRVAPAQQPPPPWPRRMDCRAIVLVSLPLALVLLLVARPLAAIVVGATLGATIAVSTALPPLIGQGITHLLPHLAACCARVPIVARGWLVDQPFHFPVPAALAFFSFAFVACVSVLALVPHAVGATRVPLALAVGISDATVLYCYIRLVSRDPGLLPGARAEDAKLHWSYLEASSNQHASVLSTPFCERAELLPPVRAKFSPLVGTLVKAYSHDCHWLGTAIGGNNHRTFLVLLIAVEVQLVLLLLLSCAQPSFGLPPLSFVGLLEYGRQLCQLVCDSARFRAIVIALMLVPYPLVLLALLVCNELWQV